VVRGPDGQTITIPAGAAPSVDMSGMPSIMGYTQGAGGQEPNAQQRVAASAAFTEGLRKYLMAQRNAADGESPLRPRPPALMANGRAAGRMDARAPPTRSR
jgi:hypothetical protein